MSSSTQDIAVVFPLLVALVATLTTIVIHGLALIAVLYIVSREYRLGRAGMRFWRDLAIIATVTQVALMAHLVEVAIWAAVLMLVGPSGIGAFVAIADNWLDAGQPIACGKPPVQLESRSRRTSPRTSPDRTATCGGSGHRNAGYRAGPNSGRN